MRYDGTTMRTIALTRPCHAEPSTSQRMRHRAGAVGSSFAAKKMSWSRSRLATFLAARGSRTLGVPRPPEPGGERGDMLVFFDLPLDNVTSFSATGALDYLDASCSPGLHANFDAPGRVVRMCPRGARPGRSLSMAISASEHWGGAEGGRSRILARIFRTRGGAAAAVIRGEI